LLQCDDAPCAPQRMHLPAAREPSGHDARDRLRLRCWRHIAYCGAGGLQRVASRAEGRAADA
jgi:hypothetical protein